MLLRIGPEKTMEVKYTIGSGIPGKTLESIFDETGYERWMLLVRALNVWWRRK